MRRRFFPIAVLQGEFGAIACTHQLHRSPASQRMADDGDTLAVDLAGELVILDERGQRPADVARPLPQGNDLRRILFGK